MKPHELIELFEIKIVAEEPDRLHAATDVDTNKIGDNFVVDRHGRPDRTPRTRMDIRHDTDLAPLHKRLIAQRLYLVACRLFQILRKYFRLVVFSLNDDHIVLRSDTLSPYLLHKDRILTFHSSDVRHRDSKPIRMHRTR